jgi:hypothetical protein
LPSWILQPPGSGAAARRRSRVFRITSTSASVLMAATAKIVGDGVELAAAVALPIQKLE